MSAQLPPAHRADSERAAETARGRLGAEAFQRAWSAGRRLDAETAVEEALTLTMPESGLEGVGEHLRV
jgi:hypothetical protein